LFRIVEASRETVAAVCDDDTMFYKPHWLPGDGGLAVDDRYVVQ
jgi:hypothetical protein